MITLRPAVLLACGLCLFSCAKPPHPKLPIGYLDKPASGETVHDAQPAAGWALAENGIADVSFYIDGTYAGAAKTGARRPDLVNMFPAFASAGSAGFELTLDFSKMPEGRHEIVAQAHSNDGASRDLGAVFVSLTHGSPPK